MNVSLTPELEKMVREKVSSGLYNNASEVVREALMLLVQRGRSSGGTRREGRNTQTDTVSGKTAARKRSQLLSLFGSVVRNEAGPKSDVDVFIDIDPHARFTLLRLAGVKNLLEDGLRREVDVAMREGLHPGMKKAILEEAEEIF